VFSAVTVVVALQAALPAQVEVDEAKTNFEAGQAAYRAGLYLDAARAFEKANRLVPNPAITFSIAQSYRLQYFVEPKAQYLRLAIDAYRRYLREVEKGGRREDALEHVAALEATLVKIERELQQPVVVQQEEQPTRILITSQTETAKIRVDAGSWQELPLSMEVTPGEHAVEVEADGFFPAKRKLVAIKSELVPQEITLEPKPASVAITAPEGADVRIDGRLIGVAPLGGPVALPAGEHTVVVSDDGTVPAKQALSLNRGDVTNVALELDNTAQRTASYWLMGAGALSLVITGIVVSIALISEARARILISKRDTDMTNLSLTERDEYIDARDRRNDLLAASTGGLVGGVLLAGVGGLLYFLDRPDLGDIGIGTEAAPEDGAPQAGFSYTASF
jgi:hypothetical protein